MTVMRTFALLAALSLIGLACVRGWDNMPNIPEYTGSAPLAAEPETVATAEIALQATKFETATFALG